MKRFGFLAVLGGAAIAAGLSVPAASAAQIVKLPVIETDWIMSHTNALMFKRYFVLNGLEKGAKASHVADAMTMTLEEWASPHRAEIQKDLDEIAYASLKDFIEHGRALSPNVILFKGDDCLPVTEWPKRA